MDSTHSPAPRGTSSVATVSLAVGVNVVCTLPIFLTGALVAQIRVDLGVSILALGFMAAAYRGAGAVFAGPLGRVADRLGWQSALRIAALTAMCVCFAVAAFTQTLRALSALLVVAGAAHTLGQTGANVALATAIPSRLQGRAFGIKQAALPASTLLAGLAVPSIGLTVGWRWAFVGAGGMAAAIAWMIPAADGRAAATGSQQAVRNHAGVRLVADRRALMTLSCGLMLALAAASSLATFTVDAAISEGFSAALAGTLLTAGSAASILVRISSGFWIDKYLGRPLTAVTIMMAIGGCGFLTMAVFPQLFALGLIAAFAFGWGFNALFWYAIVRLSPGRTGRATGIVMAGGMLGGTIGPIVFGWSADYMGYRTSWAVAGLWGCMGAVMVFSAWRRIAPAGHEPIVRDG